MRTTDIAQTTNALAGRSVAKMNGAGNEIVVLDLRGADASVSGEDARAIHRGKGLAFDQLMVLSDPHRDDTQAFVRIFNNDGSESGACGNGARCVAYMLTRDGARRELRLETSKALLDCRREADFVFRVDMGPPRLGWLDIPLSAPAADTRTVELPDMPGVPSSLATFSAVNMGNPHAIFWVDDIAAFDLARIGPILEVHPMFPQKANISLARVVARDHILLRVWERGAGLTRACGSAACATLVAAIRNGLADRTARVSLPGGDLTIEWRASDDHVLMTGPVELEFETTLDPALFQGTSP